VRKPTWKQLQKAWKELSRAKQRRILQRAIFLALLQWKEELLAWDRVKKARAKRVKKRKRERRERSRTDALYPATV